MLVPVPAGGIADVVARLIARQVEPAIGHPVFVENRAGATGRLAVAALKSARPDGSTVLLAPIVTPVIGPLVFRNRTYDPAVDLVPVTQVATYPFALAVAASHPARDVPAFVAWVHGQRGGVNVGNAGAGSVPHFLGVKLAQVAKLDLEQVPYAGAPAMDAAVLSGELAAALGALSDLLPLHRAGRLRILAVTGPERSRAAPDVATFREAGYPELTAMGWHAIYAPRHTPGDAVDRWARAVRAALDSPALRARLVELGVEPTGTTPARLAEIQAADTAYWRPIVEASGFSAD